MSAKKSRESLIFMSKVAKHIYVQSCQESSHLNKEQRFYEYGAQRPPAMYDTKSPAVDFYKDLDLLIS